MRFVRHAGTSWGRAWVHVQRWSVRALKRAGWPFPIANELLKRLESRSGVVGWGRQPFSRLPPADGIDGSGPGGHAIGSSSTSPGSVGWSV